MAPKSKRAWQRMLSGRRLNLLDPSPLDIEIEDIAHGLSRVSRWNGQTFGPWPYSVAQHCVLVVQLLEASDHQTQLAGLLHDAPEYVMGDIISPFKAAIGTDYTILEDKLLQAVHTRFGLPAVLSKTQTKKVKKADTTSAALEAQQLAGFSAAEVEQYFKPPANTPNIHIHPLSPDAAKQEYLLIFEKLTRRD